MNSYGIEYVELSDLENIKPGKYHYNYKTVNFMLNWKTNVDKTAIVFHARVDGSEKIPVFYKHNCKSEKFNILSLSDKLLEHSRNCQNTLFTGTEEIEFDIIYEEIISTVLGIVKTKTNIFFGSCSGAHPALRYGLQFNSHIIVANGFVHIDKNTLQLYASKMEKTTNFKSKSFDYLDTKELVKKYKPIHLFVYINKNDTLTFKLNKDFYLHCKNYFPNEISLIIHDTIVDGQDPHATFYPENQTFESIIENI